MLKIIIPLNPTTKKNSSEIITVKSRSILIPSRKYRQYEKDCAYFLKGKKAPAGLLNIQAHYYRETMRTVDITNLHGALHDVLVKYEVIEDDNYKIVGGTDGSRIFFDKKNPRTEITITLLKE